MSMGMEDLGEATTRISTHASEAVSTDPSFLETVAQFSWDYALPAVAGYYLLKHLYVLHLYARVNRSSKREELQELTASIASAKRLGYIPPGVNGLVMGASLDYENGRWEPEVRIAGDKIKRLLR